MHRTRNILLSMITLLSVLLPTEADCANFVADVNGQAISVPVPAGFVLFGPETSSFKAVGSMAKGAIAIFLPEKEGDPSYTAEQIRETGFLALFSGGTELVPQQDYVPLLIRFRDAFKQRAIESREHLKLGDTALTRVDIGIVHESPEFVLTGYIFLAGEHPGYNKIVGLQGIAMVNQSLLRVDATKPLRHEGNQSDMIALRSVVVDWLTDMVKSNPR